MTPLRVILGVLATVLVAPPATAQSIGSFELTPFVGTFAPRNAVGPAAPAGGAWFLRLERVEPTVSLGVSALTKWTPQLAARLTLQSVLPSHAEGTFDCRPGTACPSVLLRSRTKVSTQMAVADLLFTPLDIQRSVRPFVSAGGGLRRDHYSWSDAEVLVGGGKHSARSLTTRTSLGADVALPRSSLRVALEHFWTPEGRPLYDAPIDAPTLEQGNGSPRRGAQRDLAVTVGWRLLPF